MATSPYTPASKFDSAPLQEKIDLTNPRWRRWFQDVWQIINAIALPKPSAITVTTSPFLYQYTGAGQASVLVNGGTVSLVEFSRDGTTFFTVGAATNGMYALSAKDYLRVTYTVAPTMNLVSR